MPDFIINVKEKGAKKAENNVKGLNRALGGLKSQAMLAAGAFLGTGALVAGIKSAVSAFGEQELAEKKLEASLGKTSQALLDQAAALQQVSNFGDETIISAQALIAAFVDDEEQIKKATQATLDLAAAKGMDLNAAADLVSKTLGSSTNAMSRYGIEVTGAVGSTERLNSLTGNIADKFGGQAKSQSETYTGAIKGMNDAIGDAAESMGELFAPSISVIANLFKSAAEKVDGFLESMKDLNIEETLQITEADKLSEALTRMKLEYSALARSPFIDSPLRKDIREDMAVLAPEIEIVTQKLNALRLASSSIFVENPMPDVIQDFGKFNETFKESEARSVSFEVAYGSAFKKVETGQTDLAKATDDYAKAQKAQKEQQIKDDLRAAAISGQSASSAMKSVVRAEVMEATAGYFSSIFKSVPFPFNIGLAAGAGGVVAGMADKVLNSIPSFATGGDFVTNGEQLIRVGDNASGRERVQVTPLDAGGTPTGGGAANIVLNISGNVMSDDFVEDTIAPKLKEAIRRGADIGVS
tara:strand:+ start:1074 stop:2657 length:1584 start_codon:yes stop_codon:yes gene_type:complete